MKSLQEIKDEYAKEHGSESFYEFTSFLYDISDDTLDDVAERYAKSQTKELLDTMEKVNDFIKENSSKNYMVELLLRIVPEIDDLLKKYQKP